MGVGAPWAKAVSLSISHKMFGLAWSKLDGSKLINLLSTNPTLLRLGQIPYV